MNKPKIIIFSGAGLSEQSNIPTFRGQNGIWNDAKIEEVCSYRNRKKYQEKIESFYDELRQNLKDVIPHEGYHILKNLEKFYDVQHFTTNVDDLYEKSEISCSHIHGYLTKVQCQNCLEISDIKYHTTQDAFQKNLIHHKNSCNSHDIKPYVCFFGENYDAYPAFKGLQQSLKLLKPHDTFLIIGSSLEVLPVDYWLRHTRCHKYNINPYKEAGYNRDYAHWTNIKKDAISGLQDFERILNFYNSKNQIKP